MEQYDYDVAIIIAVTISGAGRNLLKGDRLGVGNKRHKVSNI